MDANVNDAIALLDSTAIQQISKTVPREPAAGLDKMLTILFYFVSTNAIL